MFGPAVYENPFDDSTLILPQIDPGMVRIPQQGTDQLECFPG